MSKRWCLVVVVAAAAAGVHFDHGFRLKYEGNDDAGLARRSRRRCFTAQEVKSKRRQVSEFCAPAFLIIGFGRCGTTSLSKYLEKHPQMSFGTRKEHFYFYRPEFCDLQHGPNGRESCSLEAYASQFPVVNGANVTFDATPMLGGDMGVPASDLTMRWLREKLPGLKLVVLVKSPADRFLSNPLATKKITRLQDSLLTGENAMPQKLKQLLADNCYVDKLEKWQAHFALSRFFLIRSEDLRMPELRQSILDSLHEFLGVAPFRYAEEDLEVLEHVHNNSLHPRARAVVNCLPKLRRCQERLQNTIRSNEDVVPWCQEATKLASADVVLRSSTPPVPQPTLAPPSPSVPFLIVGDAAVSVAPLFSKELDIRCLLPSCAGYHSNASAYKERMPHLKFIIALTSPANRLASDLLMSSSSSSQEHPAKGPFRRRMRRLLQACGVDRLRSWLDAFPIDRFFLLRSTGQPQLDEALSFLGTPRKVRSPTYNVSSGIGFAVDCHPRFVACEKKFDLLLRESERFPRLRWCQNARESARTLPITRKNPRSRKKKNNVARTRDRFTT